MICYFKVKILLKIQWILNVSMTSSLEPTKLILSREMRNEKWENTLQHYEKYLKGKLKYSEKHLSGDWETQVQRSASLQLQGRLLHDIKDSHQSAPWPDVYNNTLEVCLKPETIIPWKLFLMSGLPFFLMFAPIWGGKNSSPGLTANIESNLMACNFPNAYENCSSCKLTCCFPCYIFTLACSCETSLDTMPST